MISLLTFYEHYSAIAAQNTYLTEIICYTFPTHFCSSCLHTALHLSTVLYLYVILHCFIIEILHMPVALYPLVSFFLSLGPAAVVSDPAGDYASGSGANSAYVHPVNEPDSWWPGQHAGQCWLMRSASSLTPRHWLHRNHTAPDQLNQRDPYHTTINNHTMAPFHLSCTAICNANMADCPNCT